jgi:hypothetical protein
MPATGAEFIAPGNRFIREQAALPAISPISVARVADGAAERAGEGIRQLGHSAAAENSAYRLLIAIIHIVVNC